MTTKSLSRRRRWKEIRAWWTEHLTAQRKSRQTQAAYCRAQGLDPRHFFLLWKVSDRAYTPGTPAA